MPTYMISREQWQKETIDHAAVEKVLGEGSSASSSVNSSTDIEVDLNQAISSTNNPLEIAQNTPVNTRVGEPIGTVESISGTVSVTHADGSSDVLQVGAKIYQGDTIETDATGGVGITLADTSSFSLGENSEMVMDEMVYDPGNQDGQAVLSLLEGTASYVSGHIAKLNPDAVSINTPVATIGIRGTKVFLEYVEGRFRAINLLETTLQGETAGEIVITTPQGRVLGTTNEANIGWSVASGDNTLISRFSLSPRQVEKLTEKVFENLPPSLAERAIEAKALEDAIKEAADIAEQEALEAEKAALEAETQAQELEEKATLSLEEAEKLLAEQLAAEAQLEALQLEIQLLIEQGADQQQIFLMQLDINSLKSTLLRLQENASIAQSSAQRAEERALDAVSRMLALKEEATQAHTTAEITKNAARDAYEVTRSSYEQAEQYVGYQVNIKKEEDETENVSAIENPPPIQTEEIVSAFRPHDDFEVEFNGASSSATTYQNINIVSTTTTTTSFADETIELQEDNEEETSTNQNDAETSAPAVTFSGIGVDGYLSGATVFVDLDKDGIQDANETEEATTDASGNYTLTTSATDYVISMTGGTDIATGKSFYGVLQAPSGSTVVTPLTSLLASGVSESDLKTAFGIDSSIDLTSVDPVAGASNAAIAKVAAIGVQVQNTIMQAASVLEGASSSGLTESGASGAMFDAIASSISGDPSGFDISNSTKLQSVISTAASSVLSSSDITTATNAAANTASIISASNTQIDTYISLGGSGNSLLTSLAQVAIVADEAAGNLKTNADDLTVLANLATTYGSDNIASKIEAVTTIGNVDGNGFSTINNAPQIAGAVALSTNEDTALNITSTQLLGQASDTDTMSVVNLTTSSGTLTQNSDGSWTLTPAENATNAITLNYQVSDGYKGTAATANITVNAVNDTPVANDGAVALDEGASTYSATVSASDVEDSSLTYSLTSVSPDGLSFNADGTYTFNPSHATYNSLAKDATQTVSFTYQATDDDSASDTGTVTITLSGTNDTPTVSSNVSLDDVAYKEDTAFSLTKAQLLANTSDADGDTLDVLNVSVTSGGTIVDNGDATWTITPTLNSTADVVLSYTVSDTKGGTVTHGAVIDIDPVNDAPVLSSITLSSGTEDIAYTLNESAFLASSVVSDVENDSLSVSNVTVNQGSAVDNGDNWTITPPQDYEGTIEVTYTISDGSNSVSNTTDLLFLAANDAPTVSDTPVALSGTEDTAITITQSQLLTSYASDVDNDTLSVQNLATSDGGTLQDNGNSTWTYTPLDNVNGAINFTFKVSDGTTTTDGAATLTLASVDDAPITSGTAVLSATNGQSLSISIADLLNYASDVENQTLSVTNLSASAGTLDEVRDESNNLTGWTYTPASSGTVTFSYGIFDGTNTTTTTATVNVAQAESSNQSPVKTNTVSLSGEEDAGSADYITITKTQLLANASDPDGDTLYITDLSASSGSLSFDSASADWHFVPTANSTADVTFTYKISDGALSIDQTATLSLSALNDVPTVSDSVILSGGQEDTVLAITANQLLGNASDVDSGDTLSIQSDSLSASTGNLVSTEDGWNFTPTQDSTDDVTFSYVVTDGNGGTVNASAIASFSAVNDAPSVSGDVSLSATEDTNLTITKTQLLSNTTDVDGDTLLVQSLSHNGNGVLTYNDDDTWTYAPESNSTSGVTFSYNVYDGTTTTAAQAVASFASDGTTEGTSGIDTLSGTSSADTLDGLAGNDTLNGGLGDDYLNGGEGDDFAVYSGNMADYEFAPNSDGLMTIRDLNTGDGDDGTDVLVSIENYIFADQTLTGTPGEVTGTDSSDNLSGGGGVDLVNAGDGDDVIFTHNGNDIINAGGGADTVWAGNGQDTITGGEGADVLYGENGKDVIVLSNGDVTIDGGTSSDTIRLLNGDDFDLSTGSVSISSIETFDLSTDTAENILTLSSTNVASFNTAKSIVIDGTDSDKVITSDTGWTQGATSNGYTTYDHTASGASMQIGENIAVTSS
ncbi:hypothetical protein MTBPR1_10504 [Candidatus Terasakiella magnetica]|uniref:Cadherin domain-containing protein n=1 Tax=Candidatus Terasakiella magnetica TaxID=1867952 RepID=A0A1C3RD93_9PROT|nr:cadherin-like domain-containing protein [Candidatus Terasakiella magnetica]SCA55257.1 hypothetical protein MTBPR1_10504 [Candidatus Terasakiella magnetica]